MESAIPDNLRDLNHKISTLRSKEKLPQPPALWVDLLADEAQARLTKAVVATEPICATGDTALGESELLMHCHRCAPFVVCHAQEHADQLRRKLIVKQAESIRHSTEADHLKIYLHGDGRVDRMSRRSSGAFSRTPHISHLAGPYAEAIDEKIRADYAGAAG